MKVLSDYDPEKKKKQSPFYRPPTLLSRTSGPGDFNQPRENNPAQQLAQQVAEQKRMNFLSSVRLQAEEEFGKAEGSWRESVMGDGSDAGVQPLLDQFNKTADRLLAKAPDDRAKAFVNDSLYAMKMRYAQQADEFTLGKVKEQAGGLLENSLGQSLKQAQSAGPEHLPAIHQNGLTTIHAYGFNGLALDQSAAEARKKSFSSDFWENSVRERVMRDPDQAQQLLDASRDSLAPEALERAELSLNMGRAERTRKERETKLNTDRQANLLFSNRRDGLLGIAETGMDNGTMEKRFTALGRDDLTKKWRKERNAAMKLHSFFRETDGTSLLDQARQLGKKFKSGASHDAPEGSIDFALSALRKRTEAFSLDPVGQVAGRVVEALGPDADPSEFVPFHLRLQRETAKGLPGFRPRVLVRDIARQYREMYEEQSGQGRMDVLRGLEPLPKPYRRQALAEAVPGVMPQVAHLAMENGRSSNGNMKLWLEAHRPKMGKLEGDAEIEREALANLETSDVFRAVTAPLRLGGGRQGELMLDEFRRGAARYGMLRNDPMAGVRFLEENVRTLQSEGLAEIYWPTDKTMPMDLEGRLREAKGKISNMYQDKPAQGGMGNWYQDKPGHGRIDDLVVRPDDPKPVRVHRDVEDLPFEMVEAYLDQSRWINSDDGRGFALMGPDGEMVTDTKDNPIVLTPGKLERREYLPEGGTMQFASAETDNEGDNQVDGKGGSEKHPQPLVDSPQAELDFEDKNDSVDGFCNDPKTDFAQFVCDTVQGKMKEGAFEGVENLPPDNVLRQMQESMPEGSTGLEHPEDFEEGIIEKILHKTLGPVKGLLEQWNPEGHKEVQPPGFGGGGRRSALPSPPSHASSEGPDSKA